MSWIKITTNLAVYVRAMVANNRLRIVSSVRIAARTLD
jgi:hypothetical protein